ncbi:MAG: hypothetical protein ACUVUD_03505, partial [bacterium]
YRRLILLTITCRDSQSIGHQVEVVRRAIEFQAGKIYPLVEVLGPVSVKRGKMSVARILVKIPPTIIPARIIPKFRLKNGDLRIEVDPQEVG